QSWQNHAMSAHHVLRGEYAIRLRSHSAQLSDRPLPTITYEDAAHPRVKELLDLLPADVLAERDPWQQVLKLRTFVAKQWMHGGSHARAYAPWDPWTIPSWANNEWGHGGPGRIAFCVHFGAFMAVCASAL